MGSSPIFRIEQQDRDQAKRLVPVLLFKAEASLEPMVQGLASGSVGSWHEVPPDLTRPILRKTTVVVEQAPWVQGLRSASVVAEQMSPGRLAVSAPLRSAQSRHPPDVLRPIFRKAPVVVGQALYNDKTGKVGFL